MKFSKIFKLIICFLVVVSCKKNNNEIQSPAPGSEGEITLPGASDGSPKSEHSIGVAGGTFQSTDARLTIVVPAGALRQEQIFTIQRVENTNPLGKGKGYRIEPHIQFEKKVQIIFNQQKNNDFPTSGIAYRDSNGIWQAVGGLLGDKSKNTISILTDHFSEWSLFDCLYMIPEHGAVQPGQSLELELFCYEDLLAPLVEGEQKPIGKPAKTAVKYIKKWELIGPGTLSIDGAMARYHAPDGVPDPAQATVNTELDLGIRGKFILVTTIDIIYSAVQLQHDNHAEVIYKSATAWVNGDQTTVSAGNDEGLRVMINWKGGLGFHAFANDISTQFGWFPNDQDRYAHFYTDETTHTDVPSSGGITITDPGDTDGFVKGEFEINPIGKVGDTKVTPAGSVKGKFQVKLQYIN